MQNLCFIAFTVFGSFMSVIVSPPPPNFHILDRVYSHCPSGFVKHEHPLCTVKFLTFYVCLPLLIALPPGPDVIELYSLSAEECLSDHQSEYKVTDQVFDHSLSFSQSAWEQYRRRSVWPFAVFLTVRWSAILLTKCLTTVSNDHGLQLEIVETHFCCQDKNVTVGKWRRSVSDVVSCTQHAAVEYCGQNCVTSCPPHPHFHQLALIILYWLTGRNTPSCLLIYLPLIAWSAIPACPSLMCSFNRGNIEGANSSKICVWCLCVYVLCLWNDWFCRLTWQRVDTYVGRVWKCVFAYDLSLTVLRWPCVVDRTLKSNYYYYYLF